MKQRVLIAEITNPVSSALENVQVQAHIMQYRGYCTITYIYIYAGEISSSTATYDGTLEEAAVYAANAINNKGIVRWISLGGK